MYEKSEQSSFSAFVGRNIAWLEPAAAAVPLEENECDKNLLILFFPFSLVPPLLTHLDRWEMEKLFLVFGRLAVADRKRELDL